MNKLTRIYSIIICLFMLFVLVSCGDMRDTNGDYVYDLQTLSTDDIINGKNDSVEIASISTIKNGINYCSAQTFAGVKRIEVISAKDADLTISMDITVSKGNFRCVVIHNNEIVYDFKVPGKSEYVLSKSSTSYSICIAGEESRYKLSYKVE